MVKDYLAGRERRFLLIIGIVAALAILTSTMSKNPALPLLAESIGADAAQVGLIAAISPIPGILFSGLAGAYSDKHGRSKIVTLSLVVFATAPFLYLLVQMPWQLAAVRFYHGFATALFMPVAAAAVADRFPSEVRGQMLATYSSFTMVGRFAAPFLGGALLYLANFGFLYLTCGVTALVALLVSFAIPWEEGHLRAHAAKYPGSFLGGLRDVAKDRRIITTSGMEAVQYFAMGTFEAFLPLYMLSLGYNGLEIGTVMGLQIVSMLLAKPMMGRLSDRSGRGLGIVVGLLLGALAITIMPFATALWALGLLSIVFGLTVASVTASTSALVCDLAGRSAHGSAIGVLSSVMDIGHSLGPLIAGLVIGAYSYQLGFALPAALLIVGALVFTMVVWKPSRGHGSEG
ncbi:MAG: MFS transporter [Methanomassiliicoccales archaeon]|nr:MFS transporter [Methanomassiliicoccales archaeon]MDD1756337.1 MFS transporter [Methanomassiliicoccales archaeon]